MVATSNTTHIYGLVVGVSISIDYLGRMIGLGIVDLGSNYET